MWQRWANKQPAHNQISQPTRFTELDRDGSYEYDYDERYLDTIAEVDSISSRRQSTHIGLPELPFRAVPPMAESSRPVDVSSPASTITPTAPVRDHNLRINVDLSNQRSVQEISPLTPQSSHEHSRDEVPISPISSSASVQARAPLPERHFQSQIPRKMVQRDTSEQKQETKWDEYSGEPTNDERGKAASVRPGTQLVEAQYPQLKERTKLILAGLRERDAANKKPWGKEPPPVAADSLYDPPRREPWKGASGRAPIVDPIKDTPSARKGPVHFPQRNISRMAMTDDELAMAEDSTRQLRQSPSVESIKPIVPLKTRNLTPDFTTRTPSQSPTKQSPPPSPEPVPRPLPTITKSSQPRVESPQYDSEPTTPTTPIPSNDPDVEKFADLSQSYVQPEMDREQSRFSWTTYATSIAESPGSPAQLLHDTPPLPLVPSLPQAIIIKKRPVPSSPSTPSSAYMQPYLQPYMQPYMQQYNSGSTSSVARKPLPSGGNRVTSTASISSRALSTSKSLPPTPGIMEAADKIDNLDAQIEALSRRKHNVTRIITDLEVALKKNAIVYDRWKRQEVEKNITNHQDELNEISIEIHDLSLIRLRAQRKRDQEDGVEASGLWIKRVTG